MLPKQSKFSNGIVEEIGETLHAQEKSKKVSIFNT